MKPGGLHTWTGGCKQYYSNRELDMNEARRAPYVDWRLLAILAIEGVEMHAALRGLHAWTRI